MAYCKTESIVLSTIDYSETSQIVWVLARDYGLLRVLAKGSKRHGKRAYGALDSLTRISLIFVRKSKGELHIATEWQPTKAFPGLRAHLAGLYSALYAAELTMTLVAESEEAEGIFDILLEALGDLSDGDDNELALFRFELRFMRELGYGPEITGCAQCGSSENKLMGFSASAGGAVCRDCRTMLADVRSISKGALASMERLRGPGDAVKRLRISAAMRIEIREMLTDYVRFLIGREPRTLRYVETVTGNHTR